MSSPMTKMLTLPTLLAPFSEVTSLSEPMVEMPTLPTLLAASSETTSLSDRFGSERSVRDGSWRPNRSQLLGYLHRSQGTEAERQKQAAAEQAQAALGALGSWRPNRSQLVRREPHWEWASRAARGLGEPCPLLRPSSALGAPGGRECFPRQGQEPRSSVLHGLLLQPRGGSGA